MLFDKQEGIFKYFFSVVIQSCDVVAVIELNSSLIGTSDFGDNDFGIRHLEYVVVRAMKELERCGDSRQ